ncbi:MAG: hypothetical protein AAGG68_30115 [Bacteroidota bacterium]
MRTYLWILITTLSVFSCTTDDFELITEEELPFEPTEVELSESHLSLSMLNQEFEVDFGEGYGRVQPLSFLNDVVEVTISAEPVQCDGTGTNGAIWPTLHAKFHLEKEENGELSNVALHYHVVVGLLIDEKKRFLIGYPYHTDIDITCHSIPAPTVTITQFTQDFVSGVIEGNFLHFSDDDGNPTFGTPCDEREIAPAPIKISFSIPIENC